MTDLGVQRQRRVERQQLREEVNTSITRTFLWDVQTYIEDITLPISVYENM